MDIFTLRQQPARCSEIADLLHHEWSTLPHWSSQEAIRQRLEQRNQQEKSSFTLLASHAEGALMGTASVIEYELDDDPARQYWLGEVCTAEAWRGKGVGSALIAACIARARAKKIDALWLYTPDQQALYQRMGWVEIEQRSVSNEWVSVMALALNKTTNR